ncbi:MAG: hypothetical protein DMF87_01950 [Acidobacteria bacterium]|nr:MAG: hypothetical protein DMF88_14215 [Acidobacteriota bacterium]PYR82330.1 MAG: hypothetical protein DMF87_01950 [Acidobacteriota bacterium]
MAERVAARVSSPSYQAYQILHVAFTVAPVIAGLDKFTHFLVNWDQYLSPMMPRLGLSVHTFMLGVGVIEVVAGLIVAVAPRIGGWIVGLWLCGIILNLLTIPGYFDVALRDLGLALGSFALARLSEEYAS